MKKRCAIKILDLGIAWCMAVLLIFCNAQTALTADFDVGLGSYATVQGAIDGALSAPTPAGETHRVRVSQGIYCENIFISPSGFGESFRLTIQGGWISDFSTWVEDPALTVLDGSNNGSVISVDNGVIGPNIILTIRGFTIQNGNVEENGGGIHINSSSYYGDINITVENNIIRNNTAGNYGGGLYISLLHKNHTAAVIANNNKVYGNKAEVWGGGIYASLNKMDPNSLAFASLTGNEIFSNNVTQVKAFNNAGAHGGGMHINTRNNTYAIVNSNKINNNKSVYCAGGVHFLTNEDSSISFSSNTVMGNQAEENSGGLSASAVGNSILTVENNLLAENKGKNSGGVSISNSDIGRVYFKHNYVLSNEAKESTGGLSGSAKDDGLIEVVNNLVAFNQALDGTSGGVSIHAWANGHVDYYNNTVADNYASSNWGGGFFNVMDTTAAIIAANNIFWWNTTDDPTDYSLYLAGEISEIQFFHNDYYRISPTTGWDGATDPSNISIDPLFADGPLGYHYLSQTAAGQILDSPCMDTGHGLPADYGLENRFTRSDQVIDSSTVDMGFHYPLKTEEEKPGDADKDGDVDGSDLAVLVNNTSLEDLEAFAGNFGRTD